MNNIIKIILLAIFLLSFTACWSAETPNMVNQSNTVNLPKNVVAVNETNSANTVNTTDSPNVGNQSPEKNPVKPSVSPTETLKMLSAASKAKNTEEIKKTLSKKSLDLITASAANQKKTLDDLLRSDSGALFVPLPQLRKEEITGDTATLEIKNEQGTWVKVPFVLEDGKWKVAVDKFLLE